jgi:hypothetical protein
MDLEIGGNLYRNTDGTVEIEGVPQLTVALKKPEGPLNVSFVLFDAVGKVLAKIVDSTMAFNERRAFELSRTPASLVMKNTETGKTVLSLQVTQPNRVTVKQAEFTTIRGHMMEVSAVEWKVDKHRSSSADVDVKGGAVTLG